MLSAEITLCTVVHYDAEVLDDVSSTMVATSGVVLLSMTPFIQERLSVFCYVVAEWACRSSLGDTSELLHVQDSATTSLDVPSSLSF